MWGMESNENERKLSKKKKREGGLIPLEGRGNS